ncbi:Putative protein [Zobellia galactanivorans]|uniref:Uncharacterized protein n=1 Tax=Zobellia galactanivorans (strain DSM 12802 / CCUG 47099 / CIP 106680 / NCIMB 13871 / Dsij) TaxID=63186 RepID=G0L9E8_ZOBGA|nr:Putative protein [Zobellia galactanivorans]
MISPPKPKIKKELNFGVGIDIAELLDLVPFMAFRHIIGALPMLF